MKYVVLLAACAGHAVHAPAARPAAADRLTDGDFAAADELESMQAAAIPALLEMTGDDRQIQARNTMDLIYPGAEHFYGHGGLVPYELNWVSVRAGYVLENLTFEDFGFGPAKSAEMRAAASGRARAWWAGQHGHFDRFAALVGALGGDDDARRCRAVSYLYVGPPDATV
jgi:hypothetical protein